MNRKIIIKKIERKISDWVSSIEDRSLAKEIEENIIVTGGCIASMLMKEDVNDFDIYFSNKATVKRVSKYYCKLFDKDRQGSKNALNYHASAFVLDGEDVSKWKRSELSLDDIAPGFSNQGEDVSHMITNCDPDRIKIIVRSDGVASDNQEATKNRGYVESLTEADEVAAEIIESPEEYKPVFLSSNAITLSGKVQIVIRFYGDAKEIHSNYDFVHCFNYWTKKDGLVLNAESLEAILSKELIYKGSKYPLCSIIRTRKFIKRGFHINAGQYLKMCFQVSQLDLTNIDVLEDQLVGVDSLYFMTLVSALKEKMKSDTNFKVEESYVASIIDKIF